VIDEDSKRTTMYEGWQFLTQSTDLTRSQHEIKMLGLISLTCLIKWVRLDLNYIYSLICMSHHDLNSIYNIIVENFLHNPRTRYEFNIKLGG
jgi:hypothetical protein